MNLGFIGTGEITKAVVLGITKSNIKYSKIYISKRNKSNSKYISKINKKVKGKISPNNLVDVAIDEKIANKIIFLILKFSKVLKI